MQITGLFPGYVKVLCLHVLYSVTESSLRNSFKVIIFGLIPNVLDLSYPHLVVVDEW